MSLLDDIYGDDNRTVIEIATDISSPNRVARSWVFQRVTEALEEAAFFLEAQQSTRLEAIFREYGLIQ